MRMKKLVFASMMAALICVTTMLFPIPLGAGYVFVSDCFVLLAAWLLPTWHAAAAAGIGSALGDLFTSAAIYAPATLVIKIIMVLIAANIRSRLLGGILAELWMVLGYFLYATAVIYQGIAAPLTSVPGNLVQGGIGLAAGLVLYRAVQNTKLLEVFHGKDKKRR